MLILRERSLARLNDRSVVGIIDRGYNFPGNRDNSFCNYIETNDYFTSSYFD